MKLLEGRRKPSTFMEILSSIKVVGICLVAVSVLIFGISLVLELFRGYDKHCTFKSISLAWFLVGWLLYCTALTIQIVTGY